MLIRVGLCMDPDERAASGIFEKALRSIDPTKAKNRKDAAHRQRKREQLIGELIPISEIADESIYPGFDASRWSDYQPQFGSPIPKQICDRINEKILRGILYLEEGVFVGADYKITTYALRAENSGPILDILASHGVIHSQEPGIVVRRATAPEDKISSLFLVEIWGRFKIYSVVEKKDA